MKTVSELPSKIFCFNNEFMFSVDNRLGKHTSGR